MKKDNSSSMLHLSTANLIVLNLGFARTQHNWGHRDISSPFARLYYIKKGRAVLHLESGDVQTTPGHMYLVPAYVPHSYECEPGFEFYYLFVLQWMEQGLSVFHSYEFPLNVRSNEATQLLFENYCSLYPQLHLPTSDAAEFNAHPSYYNYTQAYLRMRHYERMQLHGLVEILLSYFVKHAKRRVVMTDNRMAKLVYFIQDHIHEPLSTDDLAKLEGVTKCHIIRLFQAAMQTTPLNYILRSKVEYAQMLLLQTQMSIREVGESVGFGNTSYFIRIFRKQLGYTPQEYREKLIG